MRLCVAAGIAAVALGGCAIEQHDAGLPSQLLDTAVASAERDQRLAAANELACGGNVCCALTGAQRELMCWGSRIVRFGPDGEVGRETCPSRTGDYVCAIRPLAMNLRDIAQVVVSWEGGIVLGSDGEVATWLSVPRLYNASMERMLAAHMTRPKRENSLQGAVRVGACSRFEGLYAIVGGRVESKSSSCPETPDFIQSVGGAHDAFCLLKADGTVWCRGAHTYGWLGLGTEVEHLKSCRVNSDPPRKVPCTKDPIRVPGLTGAIHLARSLYYRVCATLRDGSLYCWGDWDLVAYEQSPWSRPRRIEGLARVTKSALGLRHACALDASGGVWCFGDNKLGELGDGSERPRDEPGRVPLPRPALDIAASNWSTCAVLDDRSLWCWGSNAMGQIGDGTRENRRLPVQTLPPGTISPRPAQAARQAHDPSPSPPQSQAGSSAETHP